MDGSQTFHDHLNELKKRALWVFLAVAISGTLGYLFRVAIIKFLDSPLGQPLYYNTPGGGFNVVMKVAGVIGVFIALPVLVYNIIRFIEPAVYQRVNTSRLLKITFYSVLLALIGAAFGFYIIIPTSLHFFSGYSNSSIKPLISANDYINYVINIICSFAVFFQMPLLIDFIDQIKPINPTKLLKYQKQVVVGALIIAVILPFTYDPISQFIVAIPIIVLYYISVAMLFIKNKKTVRRYVTYDSFGNINMNIREDYEINFDDVEEIKYSNYVNPSLLGAYKPSQIHHSSVSASTTKIQPSVIEKAKKVKNIDGFGKVAKPVMKENEPKKIQIVYG